MPRRALARTSISAVGSAVASGRGCTRMSAPISFKISTMPVRVGLMPTFRSNNGVRAANAPATMKNAAEEMSAGT